MLQRLERGPERVVDVLPFLAGDGLLGQVIADRHPGVQRGQLERLVRADLFEQVLQARYLGTKRFSLEGVTSLIPLLDSILEIAGESGARQRRKSRSNSQCP